MGISSDAYETNNTISVSPKSTENVCSEELTILTSNNQTLKLKLEVAQKTIAVTIPAGNITAQGQYIRTTYNRTWTIYTDAAYTNSIGTCSFTGTGGNYSLNELSLNIPDGVDRLYFVCIYNGYTYSTSMTVTEIKDAQTTSGKVLQINTRTRN